ncbi:MAG: nitroreductase family deazaflavin-dependent oxidoreductase [Anaerolineales bacterium]|nr:nitroreductase family deazaflavin-dependent oxidoreductase [Anaerolineales bacterium]
MELSLETERKLRAGFRVLNRFMLALWRLGLARYGNPSRYGGAIMIIKHIGRKTGRTRYAPVNYAETSDAVYCTAGFGERTHWYRNLLANPEVDLWLPDSRWRGVAEDVTESDERVERLRDVLVASGFAGPLFGFNVRHMTENQVEDLLELYRLVRIRKLSPLTGPGGPGDLAWVWPTATFLLLGWLLYTRRRPRI